MLGGLVVAVILLISAAIIVAPGFAAHKGRRAFLTTIALSASLPALLIYCTISFHRQQEACFVAHADGLAVPSECESAGDILVYMAGYLGAFLIGGILLSALIGAANARRPRLTDPTPRSF